MKIFTYFKKMNKLGAAMVEYAVILAFVAAVGSSFTDNISPGVNNIIKSVSSMLGLAAGSETQQSAKDKADNLFRKFYNGVALDGSTYNDKNLLGSLSKVIASNGNASFETILKNFGIDTLYSFNAMYLGDTEVRLKAMGLLPDDMKPNSAKLLTIANENKLSASHTEPFSATQYLFYKKGNNMYLAGTRYIDSVTNYTVNATTTSGDFTVSKKFSNAKCTILGTPPASDITFNPSDVNDKFVKYEP